MWGDVLLVGLVFCLIANICCVSLGFGFRGGLWWDFVGILLKRACCVRYGMGFVLFGVLIALILLIVVLYGGFLCLCFIDRIIGRVCCCCILLTLWSIWFWGWAAGVVFVLFFGVGFMGVLWDCLRWECAGFQFACSF